MQVPGQQHFAVVDQKGMWLMMMEKMISVSGSTHAHDDLDTTGTAAIHENVVESLVATLVGRVHHDAMCGHTMCTHVGGRRGQRDGAAIFKL